MGLTFIELRRFDDAIVAVKKALRQHPFYSTAYRSLTSAFAHLERDAEAREAAARLLEVDPEFLEVKPKLRFDASQPRGHPAIHRCSRSPRSN